MFPKEHGAYGQLLFPLITALAVARPGAAAFALAGAAVLGFLAHEPLLVLLGQRGTRASREDGRRAARWFGVFAIAGAGLAAISIPTMPRVAQQAVGFVTVLAAALLVVIALRREHTTGGEIYSAFTLATLALPVALASGATHAVALTCVLSFAAAFTSATVCVRAVIMYTRHPPAVVARVTGIAITVLAVTVLAVLSATGVAVAAAPWAPLPVCITAVVLAITPPSARQLRSVGWTLVATTAATAGILIAGLR